MSGLVPSIDASYLARLGATEPEPGRLQIQLQDGDEVLVDIDTAEDRAPPGLGWLYVGRRGGRLALVTLGALDALTVGSIAFDPELPGEDGEPLRHRADLPGALQGATPIALVRSPDASWPDDAEGLALELRAAGFTSVRGVGPLTAWVDGLPISILLFAPALAEAAEAAGLDADVTPLPSDFPLLHIALGLYGAEQRAEALAGLLPPGEHPEKEVLE
ncbi:MAG: hypothetical protein U0R52_06160 [Solirubrobacterales bacterium]